MPEYQQTAALWTRGILKHEFCVEPGDMEFWMERTPDISHAAATGFTPPPGVTIRGHMYPPFTRRAHRDARYARDAHTLSIALCEKQEGRTAKEGP